MSLSVCPFNKNHKLNKNKLLIHVQKCPDRICSNLKQCIYNPLHFINKEKYQKHLTICENRPNDVEPGLKEEMAKYIMEFKKKKNEDEDIKIQAIQQDKEENLNIIQENEEDNENKGKIEEIKETKDNYKRKTRRGKYKNKKRRGIVGINKTTENPTDTGNLKSTPKPTPKDEGITNTNTGEEIMDINNLPETPFGDSFDDINYFDLEDPNDFNVDFLGLDKLSQE